jgi:1,4-alpha-glucan branching enzyme
MTKNSFGVWEITIPAVNRKPAIPHNSKVKVSLLPAQLPLQAHPLR